jgi:S1-C subfamily serine protease
MSLLPPPDPNHRQPDVLGPDTLGPDMLGYEQTQTVDAVGRRRRRVAWGIAAGTVGVLLFGGVAVAVGVTAANQFGAATHPAQIEAAYQPTATAATAATDDQQVGVVTIDTDLYYGEGEAAGTGMILTSDGTILTNNHVVEGSTSITVTVESTGKTYTADVVGTDPTSDIAVLQLENASKLDTVTIDTAAAAIGDTVTSVGNAEGTGDLVAATGSVIDLAQQITVTDELTGDPKPLTDLIEVNADVVSGDSGGPLFDAEDEVTGIVTAASSGGRTVTGYAIPIATAMAVAEQILAGDESGTVSLGLPAFLGITVDSSSPAVGASIASVIADLPAASAGLAAGDVITSIDGAAVTSFDTLSTIVDGYAPGDTITVGFTDSAGAASTVTLTLVEGPAE